MIDLIIINQRVVALITVTTYSYKTLLVKKKHKHDLVTQKMTSKLNWLLTN